MGHETLVLEECLARLRAVGPVRDVTFQPGRGDGMLVLQTDVGQLRYACEVKRGLNRARLEHALLGLAGRTASGRSRPLLLTDLMPAPCIDTLATAKADFVDAAGNMLLRWPGKLHIRIQGLKPTRPAEATRGVLTTSTGLRVIFALLADAGPEVPSYRELAGRTGVSLASVGRAGAELKHQGFLEVQHRARRVLRRRRALLDLWVGGYVERLRPRLVVGRFQSPERDPGEALATFASRAQAARVEWALTGGFGADLLTGHYRGDQIVLFIEPWSAKLAAAARWLPATHGPITVLRPFWPRLADRTTVKDDMPVAHPLLVYAELLFQGREREVETAKLVYQQYLADLAGDTET